MRRFAWLSFSIAYLAPLGLGGLLGMALTPTVCRAQDSSPPMIDPRLFGFEIPSGAARLGVGERVTTNDADGRSVVAKLYTEVGGNRIVLLPDGQLAARPLRDAPDSDRPFKPATKEEIAERLTAGPLRGFKTKTGRHYVFVYNTSEEFSVVTNRVLETMVPGMVRYFQDQKMPVHNPDVPLVAIMFRTPTEFQNYQRMPPNVLAYYMPTTNHIVMYEESPLFRVKRDLAIQESISTIAHEGAHQILHNIGVQQRLSRWPMWLSEGLAEYFAPTTVGKKLNWKGAGQVNDLRMLELELYLKGRDAKADGQLVDHTVIAAKLTSTGYATAWSMTHFLAKTQRVEFHKYVQEVAKLGPFEGSLNIVPPGVIPDNAELFKKHFGNNSGDLEDRLVEHLKKLPYNDPFADQPHYVSRIASGREKNPNREANVFHSNDMAAKWAQETVDNLPSSDRASAKATVEKFPNRAAAEAYARRWLQGKGK